MSGKPDVPGGDAGPGRKPYVPPTVESEEILETSALVCGKCTVGPTGGLGCGSLPLNS